MVFLSVISRLGISYRCLPVTIQSFVRYTKPRTRPLDFTLVKPDISFTGNLVIPNSQVFMQLQDTAV